MISPQKHTFKKRVGIRNVGDFSPFGVELKGRTIETDFYRVSFQGQEKDDEVKGDGNSVNFKYRMHDPRVGRFFAVDPLASNFSYNSSYAFCENRVIDGVELEGKEWTTSESYNVPGGAVQVHNTMKIKIVTDGYVVNETNKMAFEEGMKAQFETQYTQFDKETNTYYTASLEYEFVESIPKESPDGIYVAMWLDDESHAPYKKLNAGGLTEEVGNSQQNVINILVGTIYPNASNKSNDSPNVIPLNWEIEGMIYTVSDIFRDESGHTLGLLHPNEDNVNGIADEMREKYKNGEIDDSNFMIHDGFGGDEIDVIQLRGGSNLINEQQCGNTFKVPEIQIANDEKK